MLPAGLLPPSLASKLTSAEVVRDGLLRAKWQASHQTVGVYLVPASYHSEPEAYLAHAREMAQCPGAVGIFEAWADDGYCYVLTPWLHGTTLADADPAHPLRLDPETVAALLTPIAEALDAAHAKGLHHREVRPSRIVLAERSAVLTSYRGRTWRRAPLEEPFPDPKERHFDYLAPEVGTEHEGPPADVYALATIAFQLVSGKVPFHAASTAALAIAQRAAEPPPTLREVAHEPYADAIEQVFARGLERRLSFRYATAGAFIGDLWRAAHREPRLGPDGTIATVPPAAREAAVVEAFEAKLVSDAGLETTRMAMDSAEVAVEDRVDSIPPAGADEDALDDLLRSLGDAVPTDLAGIPPEPSASESADEERDAPVEEEEIRTPASQPELVTATPTGLRPATRGARPARRWGLTLTLLVAAGIALAFVLVPSLLERVTSLFP